MEHFRGIEVGETFGAGWEGKNHDMEVYIQTEKLNKLTPKGFLKVSLVGLVVQVVVSNIFDFLYL